MFWTIDPMLWGTMNWMVFFLSMFFVGAGMMYAGCFLLAHFREWRERRESAFGEMILSLLLATFQSPKQDTFVGVSVLSQPTIVSLASAPCDF